MGRAPCCEKVGLKRGRWTTEEDERLMRYIQQNGEGSWRSLPKNAGLLRCGKSCRLRWLNYLRKDLKRGNISADEENLIIKLHNTLGNRWSLIAGHLPGRTDNEIKNYWNSHLSRRIDSFIRRPSSVNSQSLPIIMDHIAKVNGGHKQKGGRTSRATVKKKNNPNVPKSSRAKKTSAARKENAAPNHEKNMVMGNDNLVIESSIIPMQQHIEGDVEEITSLMNMAPLSSEGERVVLCCSEEGRESKEEMLVLGPIDETEDRMIMSCLSSNNIIMENGVMNSNGVLSCTEYTDQNGFMSFNESGVNTDIKTTTSVVDQVSFSTCNGGGSSSDGQNENGEWYFTNSTIATSSPSSNNMASFEDNLGVCDWDNWVGDILESNNNLLWEEIVGDDDLMLSCWLGGENQW